MTKPQPELVKIGDFMRRLGQTRANYYRMLKRNLPGFPQQVYPNGVGTRPALLVRKDCDAFFDNLTGARAGKRPVGRPRKNLPPAPPPGAPDFEL